MLRLVRMVATCTQFSMPFFRNALQKFGLNLPGFIPRKVKYAETFLSKLFLYEILGLNRLTYKNHAQTHIEVDQRNAHMRVFFW